MCTLFFNNNNYVDATAISNSHFGEGSGPYHLSSVSCNGHERNLTECSHNAIGYHNCLPGNDAGVRCDGKINFSLNIVEFTYKIYFECQFCKLQRFFVAMVTFVCLVDTVIEMVLLRCAFMATGETSVMITGTMLMLEYSVVSCLERTHVSYNRLLHVTIAKCSVMQL